MFFLQQNTGCIHFFALIISGFVVGLMVLQPADAIVSTMKDGFGNVMKSLGLIIVLGTTLGIILEHTGSTSVMAAYILKKVGEKHAALAMNLTGFIVGLPIFCDSGYIVLSGLNTSLAKRTGISMAVMSVSLATGLYSVHCLIPPHPGAAAAAALIGADFGKLIIAGIGVAIPATMVGYLWARYAGKKFGANVDHHEHTIKEESFNRPSVIKAFLPVMVPILLIALRSFLSGSDYDKWLVAGDPVIALFIGVLLAINCKRNWSRSDMSRLLSEAAEKAGGILVIIGAGGAFGAVLASTKIGEQLIQSFSLASLGLFFPFLLTFIIKTAQGSSTVAIITAATIIHPILPVLGLASAEGQLLCVLAMGAGSMMISHANDAYFWVIAKFSGLDMRTMLRVHTISSILMGLVSFATVYLLSLLLL